MKIKFKGFQVSITFTFIAFFSFIVISNFSSKYLLCFCAVLTHELGHLIAMFLCKNNPNGLEISMFDVKIINHNRCTQSTYYDIIITSFGCLFNFVAFFIFLPIIKQYAFVNLFIGIFNLLPASVLDGGQLLYLILNINLSADISCKIVDVATIITAFPLFLLGLLIFLNSNYNFSLLFISIYLILSLFFKKDKVI